jgi:hypothetical protein
MRQLSTLILAALLLTGCDKVKHKVAEWKQAANATSIPGIEYGMTQAEVKQHLPEGYSTTYQDSNQLVIQSSDGATKKTLTFQDSKLIIVSSQ